MRKLFDRSLWIFIAIGIGNTLLTWLIMYGLNLLWGVEYWLNSAIAFLVTSVLSYFLNKRYTFRNDDTIAHTAWRFALVIGVCYGVAYAIARPATRAALSQMRMSDELSDTVAQFVGQVLFTGLNYIGQRLFAFRK